MEGGIVHFRFDVNLLEVVDSINVDIHDILVVEPLVAMRAVVIGHFFVHLTDVLLQSRGCLAPEIALVAREIAVDGVSCLYVSLQASLGLGCFGALLTMEEAIIASRDFANVVTSMVLLCFFTLECCLTHMTLIGSRRSVHVPTWSSMIFPHMRKDLSDCRQ